MSGHFRFAAALLLAFPGAFSTSPVSAQALPAFPGAEGFGAYATGGRGGRVIYVTNLNTSGPGSLQWALNQTGPKYVLFKVSGLINGLVHLAHGSATIAGQTSPGGITVRGFVTDESPFLDQQVRAPTSFAENWILRYVRMRPGSNGPDGDGLRLRYTRNAIVDHVSIGNAVDEAVEISFSNRITVQNSILAETIGGHAFYGGMLINYSNPAHGFALDQLSIHHNLFDRIMGRLPEGSRESLAAAGSRMSLEISNNLYWDPNFFVALGATTGVATGRDGNPFPVYYNLNMVGNLFVVRRSFPYAMFDDQVVRNPVSAARNQLYVAGNRMNLYPQYADYQFFNCCNDFWRYGPSTAPILATKRAARNGFPAIAYSRTYQLPAYMAANAGAFPRDPMDRRLLSYVSAGAVAPIPQNVNPANDALLPAYTGAPPSPPLDTDNDGMPDVWERAKGSNPLVYNPNAKWLSPLGYTNLEVYLNEKAAQMR